MPPENDMREEIDKLERRFAENSKGRVFAHLADAYRKAGEFAKAEGLILHGLNNHPNYISAYIVLGRVYLDSQRQSAAHTQFTKVLELDPQNMIALKALGDLAAHEGELHQARSWYERMLQIDPRSGEAQEGLKSLEGDDEAEPSEGLAASREAPSEPVAIEGARSPDEPSLASEPSPEAETAEPHASAGMPWELVDTPSDAAAATDEDEPAALESLDSLTPTSGEGTESRRSDRGGPPSSGADMDLNLRDMESWTPGLLRDEDMFKSDSIAEGSASVESSLEAVDELAADNKDEELEPAEPEDDAPDEDSGMVTETMAELYVEQGLIDDALRVYRQLAEVRPHDESLRARIAELEGGFETESPDMEEPPALIWGDEAESSESAPGDDLERQTPAEFAGPALGGGFEFASRAPTDGLEELDPFAGSFDASLMGDRSADAGHAVPGMELEASAEADLESESGYPASDLEALAAELEGASPYMERREPSGPVFDFDVSESVSPIADEAEASADTDAVEDEIAAAESDELTFEAVDAASTFDSVLAEFDDPVAGVVPDEEEVAEPSSDLETPAAEPAAPSFELDAPAYEVPTPDFGTDQEVELEAESTGSESEPAESEPELVAPDAEADDDAVAAPSGVDAFLAGAIDERSEPEDVDEPISPEKKMASVTDALVSDEEMWAAPLPVGDPNSDGEPPSSEAEDELASDTIETYLSGLLEFRPDFSPGGHGVSDDDEVASTVAGGETSEDLARFQEWLRGLKR